MIADPGVAPRDRAVPAVRDDGDPGLGEQPPRRVEQRVAGVVAADLDVGLDQPRAPLDRVTQVGRHRLLGEERRGRDGLGHLGGPVQRPAGQPRGHVGLVGVDQRRERLDPERAQPGEALVLGQFVVDRPVVAVVGHGVVEVGPDLRAASGRAGSARARRPAPTGRRDRGAASGPSPRRRRRRSVACRVATRHQPLMRRPTIRSASRLASRSAMAWRLSWLALPRTSASSTFASPPAK